MYMHQNITIETQCKQIRSWRYAKSKVRGPGEQLAKVRCCTSRAASPAPLLVMGRRSHGDTMSSVSSPAPPEGNIQEREVGSSYSLLSGPPSSVLPPFMKVSQSKTLAGPGMQRMTRGVTSTASYCWFPAPPQLSSCLLEGAVRLWTPALEVLCPVSPNTAHRPQPKPT